MKRWVITATVDSTKLPGVVSGRFGASVMFVSYSKIFGCWEWVYPGGIERIAEPQMLFIDEQWASQNRKLGVKRENSHRIRKSKVEQLKLF